MKRSILMISLLLAVGLSGATFEIEDPGKIVEEDIAKASEALEAAKASAAKTEVKVIVPAGTELYAPNIDGGDCTGWKIDESESALDDTGVKHSKTLTTYTGVTIKTINCSNETVGESLLLALVRIQRDRLVWVESGSILPAD